MALQYMPSARWLSILPAAATWCLVLWVTAACAAGDVMAGPASTPTPPMASTTRVAASPSGSPKASPAESMTSATPTGGAVRRWERVLDRLDLARSRAFARQRPALLRRVYVLGSTVLARERAVLEDYRDRGVRLVGVRLHRTSLRVSSTSRNQVTVRVVERLGPTTAMVGSRRVRLPVDSPTSRVLHLVRSGTGWRIAAVRRVAG